MARARLPRRRTRAAALLLAPVLALGPTACDGDAGSESSPADEPTGDTGSGGGQDPAGAAADAEPGNAADVAFLQAMSVHHEQALAMTELAADRPLKPQTQQLVDGISEAQGAELEEITALLQAWGEDVPSEAGGTGGMGGMGGMEGTEMEGMVSGRTLRQLDQAPDAAFEGLWLAIMQQHHEGAVAMARTVLAEGDSAAVQDLADRVVAEQSAELETIGRLLDGGL